MSTHYPQTDRWAAARAAVAAKRQAETTAWAKANPGALDAAATRHARATQARQIWQRGQATPRPRRADRPVPAPTRQFAAAVPVAAATDTGLTRSALALLTLAQAQASRARGYQWDTTKRGLGRQLGTDTSTIRRALRLLEARGYLTADIILDARGRTAGLRLRLLPLAITPPASSQSGGGGQTRPHHKDKNINYREISLIDWRTLCRARWHQRTIRAG
mgnify:CR=1 FL=1